MTSTADQSEEFKSIFSALKAVLVRYEGATAVVSDTDSEYSLNTLHIQSNKKPLFFAAVQINKNYVSYHLMPVYVEPALMTPVSKALLHRMQGKSCFNFTQTDAALFREIELLTQTGFDHYQQAGLLTDNGFMMQLSKPAQRALSEAGIQSMEDLTGYTENELLSLHGLGPSALPLLRASMAAGNLSFKPD